MSKTTKNNSWVDKDLTKSAKKKCFEENGAVEITIKNRTTKNWMEEDLSKFPMQKNKKQKKLKESKCHVFVNQVCFSYGESPRTPPLEGTSLHRRNISVERPWGILSLFTTCLPLWVKSSHQSRCHVSPTQELRTSTVRRQCSPARKNRTRRRQANYLTKKNKRTTKKEQQKRR